MQRVNDGYEMQPAEPPNRDSDNEREHEVVL